MTGPDDRRVETPKRRCAPNLSAARPKFEQILTPEGHSFIWRIDDYPWARSVWNFHPEYEIHLIRKSAGTAFVGDYIGEFLPGQLTVIGGGLPHDWISHIEQGETISGRDVVLQFDPERLRQASPYFPEINGLAAFLLTAKRGILFKGNAAHLGGEMLEAIGSASGMLRLTRFFELLNFLANAESFEVLSSPDFFPDNDPAALDKMQKSIRYIHEHFTGNVYVPEVAGLVNMSESTFSRFFKKNSGRSFTDYVTSLRVGRACRLLSETAKPIAEICFEVGYSNLSNFNRIFLNQVGKTPSAYRKLAHSKWLVPA
ncbi:AraC family transcriptional regulator [Mesorhizobium sp. PL10]